MHPIKIRLCLIGQPPPDFDATRILQWKSGIWKIEGAVETFALSKNADLDGWGYSDDRLSSIAPHMESRDITLCILNVPLAGNYYSRRLKANVVCFSFHETAEILRHYNIPIENAVLRMAYGYSLIFRRCKGTIPTTASGVSFAHDEARGCIFDMNGIKTEIALSCDGPILCDACRAGALSDGVSREFVDRYSSEIRSIRKDLYFRIADSIRRHPLITLCLSLFVAFLTNLLSSFVHDFLKSKWPNTAPEPTPTSVTVPAAQAPRQP